MSSAWTSILLYLTILSPVTGYKLPLVDQHQWEWETKSGLNNTSLSLIRILREIPKDQTEEVSKPLETSPDVTSPIQLVSAIPHDKPVTMAVLHGDQTTVLSEVDHTTKEKQTLHEAETTHTDKSQTEAITKSVVEVKFASTQEKSFTSSTKKSEVSSVATKGKVIEATTLSELHSTHDQQQSSTLAITSGPLVEDTSSVAPSEMPSATPSKPSMASTDLATTQDKTTGWIPDFSDSSKTSTAVTYISTSSEDKINVQSLMKQCMLTILILAIVCTIFIITTIALAAKLSTMKQKREVRHPATYTEMRCISSLMPDSDQSNKANSKRLKTFAAAMEDSDGDNTTLNSFLPDH